MSIGRSHSKLPAVGGSRTLLGEDGGETGLTPSRRTIEAKILRPFSRSNHLRSLLKGIGFFLAI